jgi:hypothetical protein
MRRARPRAQDRGRNRNAANEFSAGRPAACPLISPFQAFNEIHTFSDPQADDQTGHAPRLFLCSPPKQTEGRSMAASGFSPDYSGLIAAEEVEEEKGEMRLPFKNQSFSNLSL